MLTRSHGYHPIQSLAQKRNIPKSRYCTDGLHLIATNDGRKNMSKKTSQDLLIFYSKSPKYPQIR